MFTTENEFNIHIPAFLLQCVISVTHVHSFISGLYISTLLRTMGPSCPPTAYSSPSTTPTPAEKSEFKLIYWFGFYGSPYILTTTITKMRFQVDIVMCLEGRNGRNESVTGKTVVSNYCAKSCFKKTECDSLAVFLITHCSKVKFRMGMEKHVLGVILATNMPDCFFSKEPFYYLRPSAGTKSCTLCARKKVVDPYDLLFWLLWFSIHFDNYKK